MASLANNKRKGAWFETQVAERLSALTGLPIERRHLAGVNDRGDLSGVTVGGHRIVVECKNVRGLNNVPQHLREAAREAVNDDAAIGVVIQHRDRVGIETDAGVDAQYVLMILHTFSDIIRIANGEESIDA